MTNVDKDTYTDIHKSGEISYNWVWVNDFITMLTICETWMAFISHGAINYI